MTNKSISRRNFLKTSAIVTGGAIAVPTILPSCMNGANERLMIGHIGVGSMGRATVQHWFMRVNEAYSAATCDPFRERRENVATYVNQTYQKQEVSAPECKAYLDMDELLERSDIDAVNITTPDHWHVLAAIKAARAGKHIFLAKPLGLSYDNYMILKDEVAKSGVQFHYGTQQRSMSHMKLAIKLIKEGRIGEIERAEVWAPGGANVSNPTCNEVDVPEGFDYEKWTGPAKLNPYCPERVTNQGAWFQYDYAIGFLGGWGAHPLDIMVWGVKDKVKGNYSCEGSGGLWSGGIYNTVNSWDLKYEYESGFKLHFMSTDVANKNNIWHYRKQKDGNSTTFFGEKGWISVGRATAESNIPEIQNMFNEFPKNKNNAIKDDGYKAGQDFVDVVMGKIEPTNPLDDAILSDCISHMGNIAIRTGRKITWDPIQGTVLNDPEANKWFTRPMRDPYGV